MCLAYQGFEVFRFVLCHCLCKQILVMSVVKSMLLVHVKGIFHIVYTNYVPLRITKVKYNTNN